MMNYVRFFSGIDGGYPADERELARRVETAPIHFEADPAEAFGAQQRPVAAGRRQHHDFQPLRAQVFRQRQAEVVEIPVGVGEEDDFHDSARLVPKRSRGRSASSIVSPGTWLSECTATMRRSHVGSMRSISGASNRASVSESMRCSRTP